MDPRVERFTIFLCLCLIGFLDPATGDCPYPSTYTNRFWFRMYASDYTSNWIYRQYTTTAVVDNRNDNNSMFQRSNPCLDLHTISTDQNRLIYLTTSNPICARTALTSDGSAILIQEVSANSSYTNSSQCDPLFTESCLASATCSAVWMPLVSQLTMTPSFTSIPCPFQGAYQLTATYNTTNNDCYGNGQSIVVASNTNLQFGLCSQSSLRTMMFKNKTLLQDTATCMAQLPAVDALNANEAGWTVFLFSDGNVLYCARYQTDSSGNIMMTINVQSSYLSAYCGAANGSSNVLTLNFFKTIPSTTTLPAVSTTLPLGATPGTIATTSLPVTPNPTPTISSTGTTTTTTSTTATPRPTPTATTLPTFPTVTPFPTTTTSTSTPVPTTTTSTTTPVPTTTTTSTSTPVPTTTTTTTPVPTTTTTAPTSSRSSPGSSTSNPMITPSSTPSIPPPTPATFTTLSGLSNPASPISTTTLPGGSVGGTNGNNNAGNSLDNCPTNTCGNGAMCNTMTHNCYCQAMLYTYSSNSSKCVQDDRAIDDTFLKIIVPIIAIAGVLSLIAALVLCLVASPISASMAETSAAAVMASGPIIAPAPAPPTTTEPVFLNYGINDTYANAELDKSLVTYGDRAALPPPNNYVMVRSSIPPKM